MSELKNYKDVVDAKSAEAVITETKDCLTEKGLDPARVNGTDTRGTQNLVRYATLDANKNDVTVLPSENFIHGGGQPEFEVRGVDMRRRPDKPLPEGTKNDERAAIKECVTKGAAWAKISP
ncbi:MAG: hypothetical protein QOJ96_717 [Alphaproteobacteria bacterium]|nr:hypothetical protein [Alphaproteobacteria bacterium]